MSTILDGITVRRVDTDRYAANILEHASDASGTPVVFIHGNCSSSLFFQPLMLRLGDARTIAIDLRGFGDSEIRPVDATRGLRDFSDDVAAVLDALDIERAVIVGWSMGAGVAMRLLLDRPELVAGLLLESPVSPYGYGGTTVEGTLLTQDGAGSGAGGVHPDFIARLTAGDTTDEAPTSPRSVFRASYVAPGYTSEYEDIWVESILATKQGPDNYPGDSVASESWPGYAAGVRGVLNTMSPLYSRLEGIVDLPAEQKPPIVWVRGTVDVIVSDTSFFDINMLGRVGAVPDWPGDDIAPPQPMVSQTRRVLDQYAAAGGSYVEHVWEGVGHSPHLEREAEFADMVRELRAAKPTVDASGWRR